MDPREKPSSPFEVMGLDATFLCEEDCHTLTWAWQAGFIYFLIFKGQLPHNAEVVARANGDPERFADRLQGHRP